MGTGSNKKQREEEKEKEKVEKNEVINSRINERKETNTLPSHPGLQPMS